jgi:ubiquinone/menaquinone biosynthesis C-methylase UbiE
MIQMTQSLSNQSERTLEEERQQRERRFWDGYANRYDSLIRHLRKTYDVIIDLAREHIDPSKNVLEVATGTGIIALGVADRAGTVNACDISPEMIRIAEHKLAAMLLTNVSFAVQDGYALSYPDESFDVVIASNVLHVMMSPERALASIALVMEPDGVLLAPTYCHGNSFIAHIVSRIMSLRGFKAYHRWSVLTLQAFLEANGFCVVEFRVVKGQIPLFLPVLRKRQGE